MYDRESLEELFPPNSSPYFNMFKAGFLGYTIEEVMTYLTSIGIAIREKDIRNWQDGAFRNQMVNTPGSRLNPHLEINGPSTITGTPFEKSKLEDFAKYPDDWVGTDKRFFPCNEANMPMNKWGWTADYVPSLYHESDARVLSPIGWVGQNMLYQRFIVMDIDGVGHGVVDPYVIAFGNLFRNNTLTMEDPAKPGSFHLYFRTDRLIPIKHFPFAKLDLMGNSRNAAVYLKNKKSNGLPMAELTDDIWHAMLSYVEYRKENINES